MVPLNESVRRKVDILGWNQYIDNFSQSDNHKTFTISIAVTTINYLSNHPQSKLFLYWKDLLFGGNSYNGQWRQGGAEQSCVEILHETFHDHEISIIFFL